MALRLYRGPRFGTHTYIVSVLTPSDFCHGWAIFGPLADKNTRKEELIELPASEKFSTLFFLHALRYELETRHKHLAGGMTHQVSVSSQSGLSLWRVSCPFFLNVFRYQLEGWFIHPVGCTTDLSSRFTRIGSDNGLALNRWQAIIWTNADPIHWRIYAELWGDDSMSPCTLSPINMFLKWYFRWASEQLWEPSCKYYICASSLESIIALRLATVRYILTFQVAIILQEISLTIKEEGGNVVRWVQFYS